MEHGSLYTSPAYVTQKYELIEIWQLLWNKPKLSSFTQQNTIILKQKIVKKSNHRV